LSLYQEILVLYYSSNGATRELADAAARGVASTPGVQPRVRTVPPVAAAGEQRSVPDDPSLPPYVARVDLDKTMGLLLGSPTRFGNMAAPLKYFIDSLIDVWLSGTLTGKPAGVFTSTGSLHGGQETTLISMMLPLLHHGMVLTGLPYSQFPALNTTQSGGTPYGPTHVAGPSGDREVDDTEADLAFGLGQHVANLALRLSN